MDILDWQRRWGIPVEAMAELAQSVTVKTSDTKATNETTVQSQIRYEAAQRGRILFRNNSGAMYNDKGRLVRFGLGAPNMKSPDLVGITPMVVDQNMVGRMVGVATFIEVKKPGWVAPKNGHERGQQRFLEMAAQFGAIAHFSTGGL